MNSDSRMAAQRRHRVGIVGAGIGGLTAALTLHAAGHEVHVMEAAPQLDALGVGINVLPHAARVLAELGLLEDLLLSCVATNSSYYFNRFGQLIHREQLGLAAGYRFPQLSIHRGDLHRVLLEAVERRLGATAIELGTRCTAFEQDADSVTVITDGDDSASPTRRSFDVLIGCDGVHSVLRHQLHPGEGEPIYSGVNMWRGTTVAEPILGGAAMIRVGWLSHGKLVIYPIRDNVDGQGRQLINWVAEISTERHRDRDWNAAASAGDFAEAFAVWRFDWLDVPALIAGAGPILEYPMVDQDPLARWGTGRVSLLGDAAHPMMPRGSNGAGQAILDAEALGKFLGGSVDVVDALAAYEETRLAATSSVVLANRTSPPDLVLREVCERTGDRAFTDINDVISPREIETILSDYRKISGVDSASTLVDTAKVR
jgi:2-polyprenyl-6-methoxyphenol hydroxylase-like FAD-dependent oxidoreductase